jgi:hypothetical protein
MVCRAAAVMWMGLSFLLLKAVFGGVLRKLMLKKLGFEVCSMIILK